MTRIRFCHIIDGSGCNPLLYNSIKFSDREKFEYTVISLQSKGELQRQMAELDVTAFSLNYRTRTDAPSAFLKLYKYFREQKIEIVQSHLFDASVIGLTAALLARVPVRVFTGHHSHETPLHRRKLLNIIDGASGQFLANHTIAPSEQMKEIFVRDLKVPARKISVIHHGFDLGSWRASVTKSSNIRRDFVNNKNILFGAVGRIFWVKNFENLILAFGEAVSDREDVALVIVGGGETDELKSLVDRNKLEDRVQLVGRREDIASVMADFDVLIHSSIAESFGMIFIEAAALRKPIVAPDVGIFPEINADGKAGVRIEGHDRKSIAKAIREMLSRKAEWDEMGRIAEERSRDFEVTITQAECDRHYLRWLRSK